MAKIPPARDRGDLARASCGLRRERLVRTQRTGALVNSKVARLRPSVKRPAKIFGRPSSFQFAPARRSFEAGFSQKYRDAKRRSPPTLGGLGLRSSNNPSGPAGSTFPHGIVPARQPATGLPGNTGAATQGHCGRVIGRLCSVARPNRRWPHRRVRGARLGSETRRDGCHWS